MLAWGRAHSVATVLMVTVLGSVVLTVAGSTSFVAPRQPIPLTWPVATIQGCGALLALETGFGDLVDAGVRTVLDRTLAVVVVVVALTSSIVVVHSVGAPDVLTTWVLLVGGVGLGVAALGARHAWGWAMVFGLTGVGLEFTTPAAPISTTLESGFAAAVVLGAVALAGAAHIAGTAVRLRAGRRRFPAGRRGQSDVSLPE